MNALRFFLRILYVIIAWTFALGTLVPIYFAGLSLFENRAYWRTHADIAYNVGLLVLLLLFLALVAWIPRRLAALLLLAFILYVFQTVLPFFRASAPWAAALHPVNALAVVWVSFTHARRSIPALLTKTSQPSKAGLENPSSATADQILQ